MGIDRLRKVLATARVENLHDFFRVERGEIRPCDARRIEVQDALVNTGATILGLPGFLIRQLGLIPNRSRRVPAPIYGTVRLTVQDRDCSTEVIELPDDSPVLIGRILLAALDLVVDPDQMRLIGNPDHGGEPMIELYSVYSGSRGDGPRQVRPSRRLDSTSSFPPYEWGIEGGRFDRRGHTDPIQLPLRKGESRKGIDFGSRPNDQQGKSWVATQTTAL